MPESYSKEVDFLDMSMTAGKGRTYRFYKGDPLWSFGFGLSYSSFTLKQAKATDANYWIEVKNTGSMAGDEVVQVYFEPVDVSLEHSAPMPTRQLINFEKVHLKPGESTT